MKNRIKYLIATLAICALSIFATGCSLKDKIEEWTCKHDYGAIATQVVKEATCEKKGEELWTCIYCGKEKTVELAKIEHEWTESKVVKESTCLTAGEVLYTCMTCEEEKTEVSAKIAHTIVAVEAKAATCTVEGHTEYTYCSTCNQFVQPKTVVPAKGHLPVPVEGKAATCTESGLTLGSYCSRCEEVLTKQEVISAKGHSLETVKGYAATCGKDGLTDGSKCTACNTVYSRQETIPATGNHKTVTVSGYAATCTTDGLTDKVMCSLCNTVLSEAVAIPATGHTDANSDSICETCDAVDFAFYQNSANYSTRSALLNEEFYDEVVRFRMTETADDGTVVYNSFEFLRSELVYCLKYDFPLNGDSRVVGFEVNEWFNEIEFLNIDYSIFELDGDIYIDIYFKGMGQCEFCTGLNVDNEAGVTTPIFVSVYMQELQIQTIEDVQVLVCN